MGFVKKIFGGGQQDVKPPPIPTPPQLPDANSQDIFARARNKYALGAQGTILTGAGGLTSTASTAKKTLGGG